MNIYEIYSFLNDKFPFSDAESWDNSGILVDSGTDINRVLIALDASVQTVNEAKQKGAELIVSHHPVIFEPLRSLDLSKPAAPALKSGISVISAHTNYDVSPYSADSVFSKRLENAFDFCEKGILDITRTVPYPHGFGRYGSLKAEMSADEFAQKLKSTFNCDALRFVSSGKKIKKIAFCCGGGGEYLEKAAALGFDAYITSDIKHSGFISANNLGISLFVMTHYQMEKPAMSNMADLLKAQFPALDIIESELESEPSQII